MDIFTTVLTRVVPTPIKPASLKVKALLKEAAAGKLKEDLDHLENHDYYFGENKLGKNEDKQKESKQDENEEGEQAESINVEPASKSHKDYHKDKNDEGVTESEDGVKHLDLYV